jgi:uncharacterized protein YigE (DUF2233 family)
MRRIIGYPILFLLSLVLLFAFTGSRIQSESDILSYVADPKTTNIKFYWKNDSSVLYRSIGRLKASLEARNKKLVFAMNGGMYKTDNSPLGLFISEQKVLAPLNTASAGGNFYMKPNGVFYVTTGKKAVVCETGDFKTTSAVDYATQSGPMLVINGKLHPDFREGSKNLNIRNGVGILPDGKILFAISKVPVNFFDFAMYFKKKGCKNALYLDGFVSRAYLPEKDWQQTDGDFGVIIAVTK